MVTRATFVTMTAKPRKERSVPAGEFKAKCLALLDDVATRGRSIVVTKRGRPVARIVPLTDQAAGALRGTLLHEEDLLEPIDVSWDAGT
jgi:prevent-host-death family protein